MKTLHLNLKKKWFDMILSGEKTEEYREIKNHWVSQLLNVKLLGTEGEKIKDEEIYSLITHNLDILKLDEGGFSKFSTITFSNGYAKDRPQFEIEFKAIRIKEGIPKWGAEKGKKYFVISLGDIIKKTKVMAKKNKRTRKKAEQRYKSAQEIMVWLKTLKGCDSKTHAVRMLNIYLDGLSSDQKSVLVLTIGKDEFVKWSEFEKEKKAFYKYKELLKS